MARKPLEISGDKELARALTDAQAKIADLSAIHKELAGALLNRARSEVPVLTGELSDSLFPTASAKTFAVRSRAIYAAPIHFGWPAHGIESNPFLIRARDAMVSEAVSDYERFIQGVMDGIGNASKH